MKAGLMESLATFRKREVGRFDAPVERFGFLRKGNPKVTRENLPAAGIGHQRLGASP